MPLAPAAARPWLSGTALALAGGAVCLAPLLLGGVSAAAHAALCAMAMLALLLHLIDRAQAGRPVLVSWTVAVLLLGLVSTLLTMLPLPEAVRAVIDPRSTELKAFITAGLPEAAAAQVLPVIAVDPPETLLAFLRLVSAVAVFVVISDRARHRRARVRLWRALAGGGLLVIAVSVFHRLANLDHVYGVVALHTQAPLRGPLVNPNHLARMLGGFSLLALTLLPRTRSRQERGFLLGAALVLGAGVAATLSIGGVLAYAATLGFGGVLWWFSRREAPESAAERGQLALPLVVGLASVGLLVWVTQDLLVEELIALGEQRPEASKTALYGPALRVVAAHPWLGVGPGGFRTALPSLLDVGELTSARFTHVENLILDTLASHGFVLGAGLLAIGGVTGWHLLRRLPSFASRVPLLVLVFLCVGELFDFVLQIPAGLLLAAAALGLAAALALERGAPAWRLQPSRALAAWALIAILTAVSATVAFQQDRRRRDVDLAEATADQRTALLQEAVAHHPLDPWYAYLLAREARFNRDASNAMRWANRAILLDPNNGPAHIEAARVLWADGRREQALFEYRQAWASTHRNWEQLIDEVAARTPELALRVAAVPEGSRHARSATCRVIEREQRWSVALTCWQGVLKSFPDDRDFRLRAADAALRSGRPQDIAELLGPLVDAGSLQGSVVRLQVAALAGQRGLQAAFDEAERLRPRVRAEGFVLDWWMLNAAKRLGRFSDAQNALGRARRGANRAQRAQLDAAEAELLEQMGNTGDALLRWKQLTVVNPRDKQAHLNLLRLQLKLSMLPQAEVTLRTLRRLAASERDGERLQRRLDRLEVELEVLKRQERQPRGRPRSP